MCRDDSALTALVAFADNVISPGAAERTRPAAGAAAAGTAFLAPQAHHHKPDPDTSSVGAGLSAVHTALEAGARAACRLRPDRRQRSASIDLAEPTEPSLPWHFHQLEGDTPTAYSWYLVSDPD